MQLTEMIKTILLLSSIAVMGIGIFHDIKYRTFPNIVLFSIILLGIGYSAFAGHVLESIFAFLFINLFGILLHKYRLLSPGDMKYLSTIFLYINIRDIPSCILFILYITISISVQSYLFYRHNGRTLKREALKGIRSIKTLLFYKVNTFSDLQFESHEEMMLKTMPFTVPMYVGFLLVIVTNAIILFW